MTDVLPARPEGSFQTVSHTYFNVFDPRVVDVKLGDIARALANATRFGGHCRKFNSVAQHSVLVSRLVPDAFAITGLLHDASEAYLLDVPRPIKHHPNFHLYREIEDRVSRVIADKFHLIYPYPPEIKVADNKALAREAYHFKSAVGNQYWEPWLTEMLDAYPELKEPYEAQTPDQAYDSFVGRCIYLGLEIE